MVLDKPLRAYRVFNCHTLRSASNAKSTASNTPSASRTSLSWPFRVLYMSLPRIAKPRRACSLHLLQEHSCLRSGALEQGHEIGQVPLWSSSSSLVCCCSPCRSRSKFRFEETAATAAPLFGVLGCTGRCARGATLAPGVFRLARFCRGSCGHGCSSFMWPLSRRAT